MTKRLAEGGAQISEPSGQALDGCAGVDPAEVVGWE